MINNIKSICNTVKGFVPVTPQGAIVIVVGGWLGGKIVDAIKDIARDMMKEGYELHVGILSITKQPKSTTANPISQRPIPAIIAEDTK